MINLYDAAISYSIPYSEPTQQSITKICVLTDIIECRVTEEINGAYELRMVYVATGYNAEEIVTDRIIGANVPLLDQFGENYFRIYRVEKDITGRIYVYARHLAADLSYIPVRNNTQGTAGRITQFETWALMLREYAVSEFPFTLRNRGTSPSGFLYKMPFKTVASAMQYIGGDNLIDPDKTMLDLFGGEIVWDKFNIRRYDTRGQDKNAAVAYGSNMDNIAIDYDLDGVYTSFILYYQDDEFQLTSDVYSTSYADLFPYQRTEMVDWTFFLSEMEDKTAAKIIAALNSAAETYASTHNEQGNPVRKIEASMISAEAQNVFLGDRIGVVYNRHGEHISATMRIVAYEWDVIMQRYVSLTLGAIKDNLAKVIAQTFSAQSAGEDLATLTQRVSTLESGKVGIQRISASDGVGYKFSDGTLICSKNVSISVNVNKAWGSLYYNENAASLGAWPVDFVETPHVQFSQQDGNDIVGISPAGQMSASSTGNVYVYKPVSGNTTTTISVLAIGRWK